MKKSKIIILCIFSAVLICICSVAGVKLYSHAKVEKLKTEVFPISRDLSSYEVKESEACWLFNPADKAKLVYFFDYVFIARIDELVGTTYEDVVELEGGRIVATPYTNYKITVLQNIKGNIEAGVSIPFAKYGGIDAENQYLSAFEKELFPKAGETYIIIAYADENGELRSFGPNTNILLCKDSTNIERDLAKSGADNPYQTAINTYIEAYEKHDDAYEPAVRYTSKYEKGSSVKNG